MEACALFGGGSWGQRKKRGSYGHEKQQREASMRLGLGVDLSDLLMDFGVPKRELERLEDKTAL